MTNHNSNISFKKRYTFEQRVSESRRVIQKYPDKIPVIVETNTIRSSLPPLDKEKFLVPRELTVAQLMYVIRRRIRLEKEKALFIFIRDTLPTSQTLLNEIYALYSDPDGFLYCTITGESTFGSIHLSSITPTISDLSELG